MEGPRCSEKEALKTEMSENENKVILPLKDYSMHVYINPQTKKVIKTEMCENEDKEIFPFKDYSMYVHINPATLDYLTTWKYEQSENLQYLYNDFYDLLNKKTNKNYVLFTGAKDGLYRKIIETFLHPLNLTPMDMVLNGQLEQFDPTYLMWLLSKDAVICHDPCITEHNFKKWKQLLSRSKIKLVIDEDPHDHSSAGHERKPIFADSKPFIIFAEKGKLFHPSLAKEKKDEIEKYCLQEYTMREIDDVDYCPIRPVDVFYFFQYLHNWFDKDRLEVCNLSDPYEWDEVHAGGPYDYYKDHPIDANGNCCEMKFSKSIGPVSESEDSD